MLGIIAVGLGAGLIYSAEKASQIDESALKKYTKAFEKSEEAELLVKKKAEFTDKRLQNVVKKKRAIIENTVPRFEKVYSKIQQVKIETKNELIGFNLTFQSEKFDKFNSLAISSKKDVTDKELISGILTNGFFNALMMSSERYLSAARSQMSVRRHIVGGANGTLI